MESKRYFLVLVLSLSTIGLLGFMSKTSSQPTTMHCRAAKTVSEHSTQVKQGNFNFQNPLETRSAKQDYWYHIKGVNSNAITKKELKRAIALYEFIPDYPFNWIENYVSVSVEASKGKDIKRIKSDDITVNDEMRALFASLSANTDLHFEVKYTATNSITDELEPHEFNFNATVVPHKQAEFAYGNDSLVNYLRLKTENVVREKYHDYLGLLGVTFSISNQGEVTNVALKDSTENDAFDAFIMETVENMPDWEPAVNENGTKIAQDFEFVLRLNGC